MQLYKKAFPNKAIKLKNAENVIVFERTSEEPSFKWVLTHFLHNSEMQRGGRVDIQLAAKSVCHLDTVFGFLQQWIEYARQTLRGCTALTFERLETWS